ncbi:LysR family transcriptional regulator [Luteibacter sp. Lutesp34]|uniref:LysR family transcriptional regulator n=1 Tax=Luteibacter sp. Lutesp34 TaxID=3243030 RepID=UPI0039B5954B
MRREDLPDLLAFSVVAEQGSFRGAASKLGLSPSALSHAVRRLEDQLGAALLHRTTRSVAPTEAGARFLRILQPALNDIDRALLDLADTSGRIAGHVRINAHRNAAELLVLPRLGTLQKNHPEIVVELSIDEGLTDIVAEGFDVGIRIGERLAEDVIAVRLSPDHQTAVVAAPSYLAEMGTPDTPEDLQRHRCIGYRFVTSRRLFVWRFAEGDREFEAHLEPSLIVDDVQMSQRAAMLGLGLAFVPRDAVEDQLQAGQLVEVLQRWSVTMPGDFLYYPSRRTLSLAARTVIDLLRKRGD